MVWRSAQRRARWWLATSSLLPKSGKPNKLNLQSLNEIKSRIAIVTTALVKLKTIWKNRYHNKNENPVYETRRGSRAKLKGRTVRNGGADKFSRSWWRGLLSTVNYVAVYNHFIKFETFSYWIKKLLVLWTGPSFLRKNNVYFLRSSHIVAVGDYENETKNWIQTYPYPKICMTFLDKSELPYINWCQIEVDIRL